MNVIRSQPFDDAGNLLCLACPEPIYHGDFWIEVRQRDKIDSDPRLAVHIGCLTKLRNEPHEKESDGKNLYQVRPD